MLEQNNNQNPSSLPEPQPLNQKHFKAFWPIVIIATLSAIIGGLIVFAAYNAGLDEELNSLLPGADKRLARQHKNVELQPMTSKASENTADWQTYRNEEYGFEIQYPQNWAKKVVTKNSITVSTSKKCFDESDPNLLLEEYKGCQRLAVWAGDVSSANYSDDPKNILKIKVDGFEGEKFILNQPSRFAINDEWYTNPSAEISAQVKKDEVWYKFSLKFHQGDINMASNLFDEMISTFKFTK